MVKQFSLRVVTYRTIFTLLLIGIVQSAALSQDIPKCTTCDPVSTYKNQTKITQQASDHDFNEVLKYLEAKVAIYSANAEQYTPRIAEQQAELAKLNLNTRKYFALIGYNAALTIGDVAAFGQATLAKEVACQSLKSVVKSSWTNEALTGATAFFAKFISKKEVTKSSAKVIKVTALDETESPVSDSLIAVVPVAGGAWNFGSSIVAPVQTLEYARGIIRDNIRELRNARLYYNNKSSEINRQISALYDAKREDDKLFAQLVAEQLKKMKHCRPTPA